MRTLRAPEPAPSIQSCPDLPKCVPSARSAASLFGTLTSKSAKCSMPSPFQSPDLLTHRRQRHAGFGYKPETSSATISAAGCGCLASATLCPAHNESASISPVVPTIGAAGSYRRISSPEAKCAMTSPSPGRLPSGGRPAASHISAVELRRARWGAVRPPDLVEVGVPLAHRSRPRPSDDGDTPRGWASPGPAETGYPATPLERPARARRPRHERPRSRRPRSLAPAPPRPRRRAPREASQPDPTRARQPPNPAPRRHRLRWRPPAAPLRRCRPCAERLRWRRGPARRSRRDLPRTATRSADRLRGPRRGDGADRR